MATTRPLDRYPEGRFLRGGREIFPACPGDDRFFKHQCVVRRKSTARERAATPINGHVDRDLGSIDAFVQTAPGDWLALVLWLHDGASSGQAVRRTWVRLRDLEDSDDWLRRVGVKTDGCDAQPQGVAA